MVYYPANKRYRDKSILRVSVDFNRNTEPDLVERIEQQESKAGYLKSLVREDIERDKGEQ